MLAFVFLILISFIIFNVIFWDRIFPGISVAGVNIGGMKQDKAEEHLKNNLIVPEKIMLVSEEDSFSIELEKIDFKVNYRSSIQVAYQRYRTGNVIYDTISRIKLFRNGINIGLVNTKNSDSFEEYLSVIIGQINTQALRQGNESGTRSFEVNLINLLLQRL